MVAIIRSRCWPSSRGRPRPTCGARWRSSSRPRSIPAGLVVRSSRPPGLQIRLPDWRCIDVDGLLLNQNTDGLLGSGENPVAVFREKLMAASADGHVAAVVLRISTAPGAGSRRATSWPELDCFKARTRKPVVACLMDVATSGAYYLAIGADRVMAQPTAITGGIGAIFNHVNLQDAMAQLNVVTDPVKAGSSR